MPKNSTAGSAIKPKSILAGVKLLMVMAIAVFVFTPHLLTPLGALVGLLCIVVASLCLVILKNSDASHVRLRRKNSGRND